MIHFWAWPPSTCLRFIHNDDITCVCILATEAWRRATACQAVQKGWPPKIAKATPISWRWQIVTNFPISVLFVSGLLASGGYSVATCLYGLIWWRNWVCTTETNYKLFRTLLSEVMHRNINIMTQTQSSVSWNQKIKTIIYETQVLINKNQKSTSSQQTAPAWQGKQPLIWCCVLLANMVQSHMAYYYDFWLCLLSC